MPKSKGPAPAGASGDANREKDDGEHPDEAEDDLGMERRRLMTRNRAKLMALGISVGLMELQDLDLARRRAQAHLRPRPKPKSHKPAEPIRRSTRLAAAGAEPLLQLDERGGAEVQGSEAEARPGPRRQVAGVEDESGLSAEEIAARAEQLRQREASRLRELELEGLVDFSPDAAVFVVIGSTGNHYTVRLSDAKRSCPCVDCRVRKRDCKHIRLILGKLQIQDNPSQWHGAVERFFHAAAGTPSAAAAADGGQQRQTHGSQQRGGRGTDADAQADAGAAAGAPMGVAKGQQQFQAQGEEEKEPLGSAEPAKDRASEGEQRQNRGKGNSNSGGSDRRVGKRARPEQDAAGKLAGPAPPETEGPAPGPATAQEPRASRKRGATANEPKCG